MKTHVKDTSGISLPQEDIEAIVKSSADYIEGWYSGDSERMLRCLHPDLVKRTITRSSPEKPWELNPPTNAEKLVAYTQEGGGTSIPEDERINEITILDAFRHIASVKVLSAQFMDYLQLAKFGPQRWLLVNVLWELREGEQEPY